MYLIQEIESMKTITYNNSSTPIYGNLGWHTPTLMFLLALLSSNQGSQHCFSGQKLSKRGGIPAQSEYHWKLVPIVGQYLLQRRKRRHDTGHPGKYHYNSLEMTSMAWLSRFYWISWCYIVRDRNVYIQKICPMEVDKMFKPLQTSREEKLELTYDYIDNLGQRLR